MGKLNFSARFGMAILASLVLAGCTVQAAPVETVTVEAQPTQSETTSETAEAAEVMDLVVPDLVGVNTYDAEAELEAMGFLEINSQDATSEERLVLLTSNWYVCETIPAAGETQQSNRTVVLLSVKNSESCPGESSSSSSSGSSESATNSSSDTLGLGETWTDGDFAITLEGVRTTTSGLTDPELDYFLVFELSIENLTDEEQTISSLLSFDLVGSDGYSYDLDIFVDMKGSLDGSIRPGRVMRGEVAFDVEDQEFFELEVMPSFFGDSAYFMVTASEIG